MMLSGAELRMLHQPLSDLPEDCAAEVLPLVLGSSRDLQAGAQHHLCHPARELSEGVFIEGEVDI